MPHYEMGVGRFEHDRNAMIDGRLALEGSLTGGLRSVGDSQSDQYWRPRGYQHQAESQNAAYSRVPVNTLRCQSLIDGVVVYIDTVSVALHCVCAFYAYQWLVGRIICLAQIPRN